MVESIKGAVGDALLSVARFELVVAGKLAKRLDPHAYAHLTEAREALDCGSGPAMLGGIPVLAFEELPPALRAALGGLFGDPPEAGGRPGPGGIEL